jgi:thiamine-phosphate pyrophosphorylase
LRFDESSAILGLIPESELRIPAIAGALHSELMYLYAITDRRLFASREALIEKAAQWSRGGVGYVQIREKDLSAAELAELARALIVAIRAAGSSTRVLLNGPAEIAAETGCDGVHLTSDFASHAIAAAKAGMSKTVAEPVISVSCHTLAEVEAARDQGAMLALFAPVFEKRIGAEAALGQGLPVLAAACRAASPMPVFALGGVSPGNAGECMEAGAAGVAAIRLFASEDWRSLL